MGVFTAIAIGAVAAGTAVASARAKRSGEKKAIAAQKEAINKQKDIDVKGSVKQVADQDKAHYLDSQKFFREQNPDLAAAGDEGAKTILSGLKADRGAEALNSLYDENLAADPRLEALRTTLLDKARTDLDLGAKFDPSYQAELIRSGLEDASGTGVGVSRQGPVAQRLGQAIGREGVQLEAFRRGQAVQAINAAQALQANRASILSGLLTAAQQKRIQDSQLGAAALTLSQSSVPSVGLRGADVLKLELANLQARNDRFKQLGNLSAANALSNASAQSANIQAAGSFATSALGAFGGGGGAGAGGAGGGVNFNFASLFGNGGKGPSAYNFTGAGPGTNF